MKKYLDDMYKYCANLTKEESEFIEHILSWTNDQKLAFKIAKRDFDDLCKKKRKNKKTTGPKMQCEISRPSLSICETDYGPY